MLSTANDSQHCEHPRVSDLFRCSNFRDTGKPSGFNAGFCSQSQRHHLYGQNLQDVAHTCGRCGKVPRPRLRILGNPDGFASSLSHVVIEPCLQSPSVFCASKNDSACTIADHFEWAVTKSCAAHAFGVKAHRFFEDKCSVTAGCQRRPTPEQEEVRIAPSSGLISDTCSFHAFRYDARLHARLAPALRAPARHRRHIGILPSGAMPLRPSHRSCRRLRILARPSL